MSPSDPPLQVKEVLAQRLAILRNGYVPLPLYGKEPPVYGKNNNRKGLPGWTALSDVSPDMVTMWSRTWPDAVGTGILTKLTPTLDVDILDEAAAIAVEDRVRERYEEAGYVLTRIGKPPKRAFPFRTEEPFDKIVVNVIAPNDRDEKIEFLGDGQQVVVAGIHPDTKAPYRWHGGSPGEIARKDLPYIREAEAQALVAELVDLLVRDFGYQKAPDRPEPTDDGQNGGRGPEDWAYLTANILAGREWHDSLLALAGKLVTAGMNAGATRNHLFGLMDASTAPHDERWQARRDDIPRLVDDVVNYRDDEAALPPLPYINIARDPIPPREWLVPERIPAGNVTLISGEGAIGKSLLMFQLAGATVLVGRDWIGTLPVHGPVIYINCEEDDNEACRRLEDVAKLYGVSRREMESAGLHMTSFAGRDAVLGEADRHDRIQPTPLFGSLKRDAISIRPKLIVIDTAADVFAGRENDRAQTRQFITMLRGLALDSGAAVVLAAHPSLTGINTDSGLSGSTAWHNSVRARMYFKSVDEINDPGLRVLEVKKSNYGPISESIPLRWKNGVYVPEPSAGSQEKMAADRKIDDVFIDLLRRLAKEGRNVTDKKGTTFAPAIFAEEPEAKAAKISKDNLGDAMRRLFAANRIRVLSEGPDSRVRTRIVEIGSQVQLPFHQPSTNPSTKPKNPSTNLPPTLPPLPPNTPPGGGRGQVVVEATAPSTTSAEGAFVRDPAGHLDLRKQIDLGNGQSGTIVGAAFGDACEHCGRSDGEVLLIRGTEEAAAHALHEQCAAFWFGGR